MRDGNRYIILSMKLFVGAKGVVHYQGKLLLVRESSGYVDGFQEGKWDVVGGRIEPDEEVKQGLIREIKEESGLGVVPGALLGVFDGFPVIQGEKCHVVRIYFLCEAATTDVILSTDHDEFVWIDPNEVTRLPLMDDIREMLEKASENLRPNFG